MSDHDDLIAQFVNIAAVGPQEARQYLEAVQWDLPSALTAFYNPSTESAAGPDGDDTLDADDTPPTSDTPQPLPGGGRRLGEGSADSQPTIPTSSATSFQASQSSRVAKKTPAQKKFATLGDFSNDRRGHGDDDNDSDGDADDKQDFFAGGEKSGLAVKNPDDLKKRIIQRASMLNKPRPGGDDPMPASTNFTGVARTLGGDDTPSQTIEPVTDTQENQRPERVRRYLHFWQDGFSVDDGDLYATADPRNAEILHGIRNGRAPLHIMDVLPGQEVDVEIKQHETNYVKPQPKYKPFSGQGNRLGSPTPGDSLSSPPTHSAPVSSTDDSTSGPPKLDVDETQPVVHLQIRLSNGARLPCKFNASHTIGDVYDFVAAASPESQTRGWVLMTTFPSTELSDKEKKLGDMTDFKRGGVVVQKWT